MESSSLVGDFLSPESTVTSLLSSSGHLKSGLLPPEHNTTFRYGDKNYDSASAALDAYIADFENSRQNSKSLTGRLVIPQSLVSTSSIPRMGTLRNKDVLRECLTDRELDFLTLPISSLHHSGNQDRLSMTTDELLSIPFDGSLPVTHTSCFIQGLLSQSGASQTCISSTRPANRAWDRPTSSHAAPQLNRHHHHHSHPARTPKSSRGRPRMGMLKPEVEVSLASCRKSAPRAAKSEWEKPSSSLHFPHWFTSNRTDMDCSGITSVPDLKYPAWIQCFDLSKPPPTESELWDNHAPRPGAPSWVAELEDDDPDQTPSQVESQQTLRDLRLQFAEQISVLTAGNTASDIMETLSRDNRIESLILKADQVLSSLSQSSGGLDNETRTQPKTQVSPTDCADEAVSPLNTEGLLLCSSSHCHPVTLESEAAGVTEALTDQGAQMQDPNAPSVCHLSQASCHSLHANNIFKQPGPVEALKQMLFRLQAVEAKLQPQCPASAAPALTDRQQTGDPSEADSLFPKDGCQSSAMGEERWVWKRSSVLRVL
ncbi:lung adenoma susceptibility protein 2 isoform X2 [Chaetodon auriga]|uniref:lung adenoma susceptibility protein 2 isoform X2 n=1 Tax=Chaetodon auriga TaxID=39042 RepID=UPI00403306F5